MGLAAAGARQAAAQASRLPAAEPQVQVFGRLTPVLDVCNPFMLADHELGETGACTKHVWSAGCRGVTGPDEYSSVGVGHVTLQDEKAGVLLTGI